MNQDLVELFNRAKTNSITRDYMHANEYTGLGNPMGASVFRRRGVKDGIPRVFLAYPMNNYHGLWIEMKHSAPRKGILTANQIIMLDRFQRIGYDVHVAYGWKDAWKKIGEYLQLNLDENINT